MKKPIMTPARMREKLTQRPVAHPPTTKAPPKPSAPATAKKK